MAKTGKFLSALLATALLTVFSTAAFASVSSPTASGVDEIKSAEIQNLSELGMDVEISVLPAQMSDQELATLEDAVDALVPGENVKLSIVDVELVNSSDKSVVPASALDGIDKVTVAFVRNDASNIVGILYWNSATSEWDIAESNADGDTVTVDFEHFCTVAFIIRSVSNTSEQPASNGSQSGSATVKSPQTGSSGATVIFALASAACLAAAVLCVRKARVA